MFWTILFFIFIILGNGIGIYGFLPKRKTNPLFEVISFGLGSFFLEILILGYAHLIYPLVFAIITVGVLICAWIWRKKQVIALLSALKIAFHKSKKFLLVLAIALVVIEFLVLFSGSHTYPYLEDGDPWSHANGVRYVSVEHTHLQEIGAENIHYLSPYPPIYTTSMGLLFQIESANIPDILKLFNVLYIALGMLLAYIFFSKIFDEQKAFFITLGLTVLPAYMSHFIWAQTIAIILIFPTLYFLEKVWEEKINTKKNTLAQCLNTNTLLAVGFLAISFIVQPSHAAVIGILAGLHMVSKAIFSLKEKKKIIRQLLVITCGLILSWILFWGPVFAIYGVETTGNIIGFGWDGVFTEDNVDTSGGEIYSLNEIVIAQKVGKIDQQIGLGLFISIAAGIGLLWLGIYEGIRKKNKQALFYALVTIVFLVLVEGNMLPFKLFPHRMWVYLAIGVAVMAGLLINRVLTIIPNRFPWRILYIIAVLLLLAFTSFTAKYAVQTSYWPEHQFGIPQISSFYAQQHAGANAPVFFMCRAEVANGFGYASHDWSPEIISFRENILEKDNQEIISFLKSHGYKYIAYDASCLNRVKNASLIQMKYQEKLQSGFTIVERETNGLALLMSVS